MNKKTNLSIALTAAIMLAACSSDEPGEKLSKIPVSRSQQEAVYTQNEFSMRLLNEVIKHENNSNVIISPIGVSMDMCMIASAADEDAARQIYDVLGFNGMDMDEINALNKTLTEKLPQADRDAKVRLANSVWADLAVDILPSFSDICENQFGADMFNVDIDTDATMNRMNKWCADKTSGMIKSYLDTPVYGLDMTFVNVTYFSSFWSLPFNEKKTAPAKFHNMDGTESVVSMMNRKAQTPCWKDDNETGLRLIYGNGGYTMTIVLPDEGVSLKECIAGFDEQKIQSWNEYISTSPSITIVDLYMPKFSTEYKADMSGPLSSMGISNVFEDNFVLPGAASHPISLGHLYQKSRIDVTETKTEAASVTNNDRPSYPGPIQEENIEIHLDRPFFYWISEQSSGAILFTGAVMKF